MLKETEVLIIGGGISGMCTAIDLLNQNISNFVILEKSTGFGGEPCPILAPALADTLYRNMAR